MVNTVAKTVGVVMIGATLLFGTSACAPEKPESSSESEILTMKLPADVTAKGVVLASVLLGSADIELALAEGLVTPAEVEAAEQAVKEGNLQDWVTRAESEIN